MHGRFALAHLFYSSDYLFFLMVYEPQEDSFLLKEFVARYARGNVLDMGTGSGIQAREAAHSAKVSRVLAVDIDKGSLAYAKKHSNGKWHRKISWLHSDLFSKVPPKKYAHTFDTIIFNPPYLPQEGRFRHIDLEGGKEGHETIARFLEGASHYLKKDGQILLVFSSLAPHVRELVEKNLYVAEELGKKHVFFEDVIVWLLRPNPAGAELDGKGVCCLRYFAQGKRGLVFVGKRAGKAVAVKIKKQSSESPTGVAHEAAMLRIVNKEGIGPKFILSTEHALVYEFVRGKLLREIREKNELVGVAMKVLNQCFTLDRLQINKQEMTRPWKHVIVKGSKVTMIDFERARKTSSPHNVTQFCQFIGNNLDRKHKKKWVALAKGYSEDKSEMALKKMQEVLRALRN